MLRFRRAADLLLERPELTLADVAFACGYYDQAHLDRDFREFAQTTPTAYAVTSVQDAAAPLS
jgi:transcriptional regulator GlxA family with amidase domain